MREPFEPDAGNSVEGSKAKPCRHSAHGFIFSRFGHSTLNLLLEIIVTKDSRKGAEAQRKPFLFAPLRLCVTHS